ncbi:MAG TPA: hypothetical protein VJC07_03005, partial [Candidatus Nanoarchaeia archaeon]|nr:hypothetical protein [Candidatus Nanoarchaeia archaeon]
MKKIILLMAMLLLLVAGCTQFSSFIKANRYTPPEPEPNQRISSGVNLNFFPGEPPSNEIKGQFLVTLEARNFMSEQQ